MEDDSKLSNVYLKPKTDSHVRIGKSYQANVPETIIPTHMDKSNVSPSYVHFDLNLKNEKELKNKDKINFKKIQWKHLNLLNLQKKEE